MKSKKYLINQRKKLMKKLHKIGPFIEGSLTKVKRICGGKGCGCGSNPKKKHPAMFITWKDKNKTQALYVPVTLWKEAKTWNKNYKLHKKISKKISDIQKELLKLR